MSYQLTQSSSLDLEKIYIFTAELWGRKQAGEYLLNLEKIFDTLAKFPELGKNYETISRVKIYPFKSHNIVYLEEKNTIVVLRILHYRQDFESNFGV